MFGEVYPDPVRVVSIGKPVDQLLAEPGADENRHFSIEFCGGTHLRHTGEAQAFALVSEEGIAKARPPSSSHFESRTRNSPPKSLATSLAPKPGL